jgi:hypothetical protein
LTQTQGVAITLTMKGKRMADDYLNIGSTPPEEDCAQVGANDYSERSRVECRVYAEQLKRIWPNGDFRVKSFPHDFGSYREVVAYFDPDNQLDPRNDCAFEAEAEGPMEWDDEAWRQLGAAGYGKEYLNNAR